MSFTDVLRKIGKCANARNIKNYRLKFQELNIDVSHFSINGSKSREIIIKKCPICEKKFSTKKGDPKEKTTCSHGCSNTFFIDRRNKTLKQYRTICFRYHKRECVICGEKIAVDVHHYDENHKNNLPENLIPICANHHHYWHSKHRVLIKEKLENYVNNFIKSNKH